MAVPFAPFLTEVDLTRLQSPRWLIAGVLPEASFVVVYGEPGAGKTFVVLSMILACGAGIEWCNRRTTKVSTVYIAGEGVFGLRDRVAAFKTSYGIAEAHSIFLPESVNLLSNPSVDEFIVALVARELTPKIIVIDTLARCFVGGDENSAKDMGIAVTNIDRIRKETGATVIVVHHSGKNRTSERGSSALRGAADVMFSCETTKEFPEFVKLTCDKMKDAQPFGVINVKLHKISLPGGRTSLAVSSFTGEPPSKNLGENIERALIILRRAGASGLTHAAFLDAFVDAGYGSKSTFNRTLTSLRALEDVEVVGGGQGKKYRFRGENEAVPNPSQTNPTEPPKPVPPVPFSRERTGTGTGDTSNPPRTDIPQTQFEFRSENSGVDQSTTAPGTDTPQSPNPNARPDIDQ